MEVGPVDVYIIGFPGNKFTGRIAPAILELVENGTIRILDLLFVSKDAEGVTTHPGRGSRRGGRGLPRDRRHPARRARRGGRRGGQRRPAGEQLGTSDRVREHLGGEARRRPPGRRTPWSSTRSGSRPRSSRLRSRKARTVHSRTRGKDMGLLRMAARTAVVAGTATAVSGRVQRRQAARYDQQDARPQQQQARSRRRTAARRGRPRRTPTPSSRTWRSSTTRACSPTRSSRRPRPRSSGSDGYAPVRAAEAYSRLAGVYDEIVVDPCHDRWAAYLHELWSADPEGVRSVLDLCCGTGLLARRAHRARLSRRRRRRIRGDAGARPPAARSRGELVAGDLPASPVEGTSTPRCGPSTASTTSPRTSCG